VQFPERVALSNEDKLLLSSNKIRDEEITNKKTNINFTRKVSINYQRKKMGDNLSFAKCSLNVTEDKFAIMSHDDKSVKDPVKMKVIADTAVND